MTLLALEVGQHRYQLWFYCDQQVDSRIPFLSSGLGYPVSPLLTFQSFPDAGTVKSVSPQASGVKVGIKSLMLCFCICAF